MKIALIVALLTISCNAWTQSRNFCFVFLNKKIDAAQLSKEESDKIMEGHMGNIKRLAQEGKLISAGPFEVGGGIFILNTSSIDEAKVWIGADPGVKANRWNVEIFHYTPRIGSACPVNEPYEMVMYQFIRFKPDIRKATLYQGENFLKHDEYLLKLAKEGNIVTEGIFDDSAGGILVMKGDLKKDVIEADPAVRDGLLDVDFQQLWIARGAFCEK